MHPIKMFSYDNVSKGNFPAKNKKKIQKLSLTRDPQKCGLIECNFY